MKDTIIIGAGIAGLSAGFELHKNNSDFQILETSHRAGGVISTQKINDFLIEAGPHTFSSLNEDIFDLVKELEIEDLLLESNPESKKRYVYLNNKLTPVPSGPIELFKSDVLSKDGKMTLLEEFFIKKEEQEESIEDFFTRRFGREVLKNFIQPFLNGVYAGDVKKLSANAVFPRLKDLEGKFNSIILGVLLSQDFRRAFKKLKMYSFRHGMETITDAMYERLKSKVTLSAKDIEITKAKDFFIVNFKSNNKSISYTTNSVLFAIPAHKMTDYGYIIPNNHLSDFTGIEYMPVATINQATDKTNLKKELDGFGFLCTKEPHRKLLGTIWTSSIFPDRAPENKVLLTSYTGGAYYKRVMDQPEEEIKNLTAKEVAEILGISDPGLIETINMKVNQFAIPQYNMGHLEKVRRIEELMDKNHGLFFTGNYLHGISVNDTIKTSKSVVKKINEFLNTTVKKQEILVTK